VRGAPRGSVLLFISDLLDLPDRSLERVAALASHGRVLVVLHLLDPDEDDFPFGGTLRLRALEGEFVVETDAETTRARYLAAVAELRDRWERAVEQRGGRFVAARTDDDPVTVVRRIIEVVR